jgi:sulfoxide reductase heme-binding subunit YedZ
LAGQYVKVPSDVMKSAVRNFLNSKYLLWAVLALPFLGLLNSLRDIYGEILHISGELSARLLLVTLAITPLRLFFADSKWPGWLLSRRRYFGVATFMYAALHTAVYLDRKIGSGLILQEARDLSMWTGWLAMASMWTGWLAMAIFVPLALTSNDASLRWLKRKWKRLHRWIYPAALLTFVHWIFAAFSFVPGLIHLGILLVLETYRIWKHRRGRLSSVVAP